MNPSIEARFSRGSNIAPAISPSYKPARLNSKMTWLVVSGLILSFLTVACGGGGGDGNKKKPTPTWEGIANPSSYEVPTLNPYEALKATLIYPFDPLKPLNDAGMATARQQAVEYATAWAASTATPPPPTNPK